MTDEQLELPGVVPELRDHDTPMVKAATRSLAALEQLDMITERHAVHVQLVLSLARAIDGGAASGRASAVAMAAQQLRETMLVLDPPPDDGAEGGEARQLFDKFVAAVESHANSTDGEPL